MSLGIRFRHVATAVAVLAMLTFPARASAADGAGLATAGSGVTDVGAGEQGSGPASWSLDEPALAPDALKFSDVSSKYKWATSAINYVASKHHFMDDYGNDEFKPGVNESRALYARAVVKAFAPDEKPDPSITFDDLPESDPLFEFANVAVKLRWMHAPDGKFHPDQAVTLADVYEALVDALPLAAEVKGLDEIHMMDGTKFDHPADFPTLNLGQRISLHYNHSQEGQDVGPPDSMPRAEVAYSLWRARTVSSDTLNDLERYQHITLPNMSNDMKKVVEWGMRYVGYPYIWGGEWNEKTKSGYCCGAQPRGGFDCSGLMWWLVKRPSGGYDNAKLRGYKGWRLTERVSADMASQGKKVRYKRLKPGDLMFYDGSNDGVVDHVDLYVGKGYSLDSSSSAGGVSILISGHGWYRQHFEHGRHIM